MSGRVRVESTAPDEQTRRKREQRMFDIARHRLFKWATWTKDERKERRRELRAEGLSARQIQKQLKAERRAARRTASPTDPNVGLIQA